MTEEEIKLVVDSWAKVTPIADKAAELFYGRLFEQNPELKELFKGDMTEQGKKLMQMISTAVANLTKLDDVVPAVQKLGERHVGYGVKEADYEPVGAALIWTLGQGLGEAFTDDVKNAWVKVYGTLSGVMIESAAKVA